MRFSFALTVFSVAAFAAGSTINLYPLHRRQSFPTCSMSCLNPAGTNCSAEDDGCLCRDTAFIDATTACIQAQCTGSDLTNAEAAARALCAAVGVTISSASDAASASTPAASTPAESSSTPSAPSSTSPAPSSSATTPASSTGTGNVGASTSTPSKSSAMRSVPALSAVVAAALGAALAL